MQQHMHDSCQPQGDTRFLITTLQETPTFYIRELGEIARIILIYAQTMSLTYIYQHCTTVSVVKSLTRNPLTFLSEYSTLITKHLLASSLLLNTLIFKQTVRTSKGMLCAPTAVVSYCCFRLWAPIEPLLITKWSFYCHHWLSVWIY